jgi:hypothetical protein
MASGSAILLQTFPPITVRPIHRAILSTIAQNGPSFRNLTINRPKTFWCNLEQTAHIRRLIIHLYQGELNIMPLFQLGLLIVVGALLWLVNTYIPMARSIKSILNAVVVIVVVMWLLNVFGILDSVRILKVGRG